MPTLLIPQDKKWIGILKGDYSGNIFLTKNIDLERSTGNISLGDSLSIVASDIASLGASTISNLTTPVAFLRISANNTDQYWALGNKLFVSANSNPTSTWSEHTAGAVSGVPPSAPLNDMKEFASNLYVATSTNVDRLVAGAWTNNFWTATTLTSNPHRFEVFSANLLFTDGRFINQYDGVTQSSSSTTTPPRLTLPSQFTAQWIRSTADLVYIGTSVVSGEAEIFFWDRVSSTYNSRYGIGDTSALCGFTVYGLPYIVTKKGEIKRFSGNGFVTVQQFPTVELYQNINNIDPNGVVVNEGIVKFNVDFGLSTTAALQNMRVLSGIWTFDVNTNNLYHSNSVRSGQNDYSQQEVNASGALIATAPAQGRYLVGASSFINYSSSNRKAIYKFDEGSSVNRGYVITPRLSSQQARRFWGRFVAKFKNIQNSAHSIRAAYRVAERVNMPAYETVTWVDKNTFSTANLFFRLFDFVEILSGDNAGALAKIINIVSQPSGVNNVTIDLDLNGSVLSSRVRYLDFIDMGTMNSFGSTSQKFLMGQRSSWVQFLIELRGAVTSPVFEGLTVDYEELPV